MNALVIAGGRRLLGEVDVAGSKNSALALMSAVVLAEGTTILHNVPDVSDTRTKAQLLQVFGAKTEWHGSSLHVDCSNLHNGEADEEMVRSIRTSFYLLGPLVARLGRVTLPAPGGCKIGARPVDLHIKGLTLLGARIDLVNGVYSLEADSLLGAEIYLDFPSAGATQHLMTAAALARGITVIQNAAMEPEVTVLADFLNRMGARVEGAGTSTVTIQGMSSLSPCEFRVPSDRLQAGTYMLAGAITGGDVKVKGILPEHQSGLVNKLREAGAEVSEGSDWIRVGATERLKGIRIKTMPYPGFPTDIQQPMAALLTLAEGTSVVEETIYESRIGHVQELNRMGANIIQESRSSIINGVSQLRGTVVVASDLRAGAALVLAGLAADGETIVRNVHFIDRGYERLEETLQGLGGRIVRIPEDELRAKRVGETVL
ncbi:UDP-N-acetylglucosamine 1-carboxyvinyltransferase [Fimbriimonas ginsengisoli]|uniref:UDP-N-acetylglucosamine 1-carboxyvinyltransferase n=1 Tax=Fimbriimonas ginsengisoli Gsoil 348 TaxID=661478 RepID=A0A068NVU4_FIMGI|nr:UDP-N-acetylglucosamine 1-carboxyvinyltransferase [Fimbriimonas ginsengisoli]AIE87633.1 UDP-N-acetylglucosamine 1-carboxyvinyltransferase [Fimbriimonas ginsengisoli Gsoil 348]